MIINCIVRVHYIAVSLNFNVLTEKDFERYSTIFESSAIAETSNIDSNDSIRVIEKDCNGAYTIFEKKTRNCLAHVTPGIPMSLLKKNSAPWSL